MFQTIRSTVATGLVVGATLFCGIPATHGQSLQQQLKTHVPRIIEYLNERGCRTVGVLKFRTKKSGEPLTDQAGPINSLVADRLECALILANPFDADQQLNIIKDASRQLADNPEANHLTPAGRAACFAGRFEIAWGDQQLPADAFLTGIVQLQDQGNRVTIGILCFTKDGKPLEPACQVFQADLDAGLAAEFGESFVLRSGIDAKLIKGFTRDLLSEDNSNSNPPSRTEAEIEQQARNQAAVQKATQVRQEIVPFPLVDPNAPVQMIVMYDGRPVPVQIKNGQAFIPEPRAGQRVEFVLQRAEHVSGRVAVVLKVNGENTLFRQTFRDFDCNKWLLSEQTPRITVSGYQVQGTDELEAFQVLSDRDSAERAIDYGRFAGQIQLTVFREAQPAEPAGESQPDSISTEDEDMLAMMRAIQPAEKPDNLGALKQQLRRPQPEELATRGLIVQGERRKSEIRRNQVQLDPTPLMAATITYYQPAGN